MKPVYSGIKPTLMTIVILGSLSVLAPNMTHADAQPPKATGFLDKAVDVNGKTQHYALYVPADYSPDKAWPLIVFLHGAGERGDDNLKQTEVGIGKAIRLNRDWFPALVLMPQCPAERFWDAAIPTIEAAMAQTQADYHVDDRAISLTGLSLGGYGTWIWGAMKTDTFAALMPVCGGGDPDHLGNRVLEENRNAFGSMDERVQNLATVPIWAFHGANDGVVPPERSRDMVERVKKARGNVQYTEFKDTDHNSWDQAYGTKKHIKWLLKQRKR